MIRLPGIHLISAASLSNKPGPPQSSMYALVVRSHSFSDNFNCSNTALARLWFIETLSLIHIYTKFATPPFAQADFKSSSCLI